MKSMKNKEVKCNASGIPISVTVNLNQEDINNIVREFLHKNECEPVFHAHWGLVAEKIVDQTGEIRRTGRIIPVCSHCKHADKDFKTSFQRCPCCGAKMDEE